jgi:hypothetical protein
MSDEKRPDRGGEGYEWEGEPDLTSISEEERALSYCRRVLQGRIGLIRAELVRCGGVVLSPEDLARVLMGGESKRFGRVAGEGGV